MSLLIATCCSTQTHLQVYSLLQSWTKHWAEPKFPRSERVSRAIANKTGVCKKMGILVYRRAWWHRVRSLWKLVEKECNKPRHKVSLGGGYTVRGRLKWGHASFCLSNRAQHTEAENWYWWYLNKLVWKLLTPQQNYTVLMQLSYNTTECKPFHSRQSYHIVNSVFKIINITAFHQYILQYSFNVDFRCSKLKGSVHQRTEMSQNDNLKLSCFPSCSHECRIRNTLNSLC